MVTGPLHFCPSWGLRLKLRVLVSLGSHALPLCAEPQYFRFEGVWLTETGMAVLRNLTMSPLHKRRQRRGRLGLPGEAGLEGSEPSDALGPDDKKDGDLDTEELLKGEGKAGESGCQRSGSLPVRVGCWEGATLSLLVIFKPLLVLSSGSGKALGSLLLVAG